MKKFWVIIYVSLAMIFWGITFVAFKYANESFRPISIVFIRLLISIPFLMIFAWLSGRWMKMNRKDFKWFLLLSFFEPFIYFLGEAFGLTIVSATLGAIIVSTIPLFVPIAAYIVLKERLSPINISGLLISFVGVVMVITGSEGQFTGNIKGIILMFIAVFAAVGYTMIVKKLIHDYNGIYITAWQSTLGALMFIPLFILFEIDKIDFSTILPESIVSTIYLGIFGSGICFVLFAVGIRELGASKANVFANLVPVVAAVVSYFMLKEEMPATKIIGIAIVLVGLFLSQLSSLNKGIARK